MDGKGKLQICYLGVGLNTARVVKESAQEMCIPGLTLPLTLNWVCLMLD